MKINFREISELQRLNMKELAIVLAKSGYRRVSNKYRIVARVDRVDWQQYMEKEHPFSPGVHNNADYYRRCESEDWIEAVPLAVFKRIPTSNHGAIGYRELQFQTGVCLHDSYRAS